MRIHHRILVVENYLLHTPVKLHEKFIDNSGINLASQENVNNVETIYLVVVRYQQRFIFATNVVPLVVSIHHIILDSQKHLFHTLFKLLEKVVDRNSGVKVGEGVEGGGKGTRNQ